MKNSTIVPEVVEDELGTASRRSRPSQGTAQSGPEQGRFVEDRMVVGERLTMGAHDERSTKPAVQRQCVQSVGPKTLDVENVRSKGSVNSHPTHPRERPVGGIRQDGSHRSRWQRARKVLNGEPVDEALTEVLTTVDGPDLHAVAEGRELPRDMTHVLFDAANMGGV